MADKDLRDLVFEALDNAVENGYGQELRSDTLENVAINLLDYDAAIAEASEVGAFVAVMDLIPHIEAWRVCQVRARRASPPGSSLLPADASAPAPDMVASRQRRPALAAEYFPRVFPQRPSRSR